MNNTNIEALPEVRQQLENLERDIKEMKALFKEVLADAKRYVIPLLWCIAASMTVSAAALLAVAVKVVNG